MGRTLMVVFDGEVFRPTEPVDLPANTAYHVTIEEAPAAEHEEEPPLMKYLRMAQTLDLPEDFAEQHDHELYGTPKR
jgi:hypothetical protein